jgi:hypothetical protein
MKSAGCRLSSAIIEHRNLALVEAESADWKSQAASYGRLEFLVPSARCRA